MTKRIVSSALTLLLIFSLLSVFAAADSFCNLGSVFSGAVVNYRIADIADGFSVWCDTLPEGLQMSAFDGGIFISGIAQNAGSYSFIIYTDDPVTGNISCNVNIAPSAPEVVASSDIDCFVGDYTLMSAGSASGDAASYQWYSGCTPDGIGGYAIIGANGPEYSPPTGEEGTVYYCCVVTNTAGVPASSRAIRVTVSGMGVESISVNTLPTNVDYRTGQLLDVSGLTLNVRYINGKTAVVSEGFKVSPARYDETNSILTLNVEYKGCICSVPVKITPVEPVIAGISMVKLPNKQEFAAGELFDGTGLVFRVIYQDGTYSDMSSDYTVEPALVSGSGTQNMTLRYKDFYCIFPITVTAPASVSTPLEIASTPAKLSYNVGDRPDTSGLVLRDNSNGVSSIVRDGYTVSPEVFTTPGRQNVTVTYNNRTTYYTVDVADVRPTAESRSTDSGSVTTDIRGKLESAIDRIDIKPTGNVNKGAIVIILVVALLALGALGVYMVVLENGGVEEIKYKAECFLYNLRSKFRKK